VLRSTPSAKVRPNVARFEDALAQNPAPRRLGDVVLHYDASMLVGEARRAPRSMWPTLSWTFGVSGLVAAIGAFAFGAPVALGGLFTVLGAVGLAGATWLEVRERRTRRFVVNFATTSLRLDFVTPFVGRPRTLVVSFDAVRSVELFEQGDGRRCLTVDFVPQVGSSELLREVLAAFIGPEELEQARRLQRVLKGAFGLGAPPHDSPALVLELEPGEGEPTV